MIAEQHNNKPKRRRKPRNEHVFNKMYIKCAMNEWKGEKEKMPIPQDGWKGVADYEPYYSSNKCFKVNFGKIVVEGAGKIPSLTVELFLDDTCNFYKGLGNQRFIRFNNKTHCDGNGNLHIGDVTWCMMGAAKKKTTQNSTMDFHKMPDVAKVVVTAEVDGKHGVIGGTAVPLKDLSSNGARVPIYNSFVGEKMSFVNVVFYDSSFSDDNKFPSHLFKPSQLLNFQQAAVISNFLGNVIDEFFVHRMDEGRYSLPDNTDQSSFNRLDFTSKMKTIQKAKGMGMFLAGQTPNARYFETKNTFPFFIVVLIPKTHTQDQWTILCPHIECIAWNAQ